MRAEVAARPGAALLLGGAALATLLGLVPVAALSVIGLPFVPFVGLAILVAWTLAYLLGIHVVVTRLLRAFGAEDLSGMGVPLLGLAAGLGVAAVLNAVPVLGWMANFALVLLGMGGLARALMARLPAPAGAPPVPAP
jgi:hypothetical protein